MKKFLAITLCLAMILSFAACGKKEADEPVVGGDGTTWDCVEYETLEELNAVFNTKLCAPGVMGVTDTFYAVIGGNIAEYKFTVNSYECTFRATPDYDFDPSGVYLENGTAFQGIMPSDETQYAESEDCKLARWATIDAQYVFCINDNKGMEQATFESVADELKQMTKPGTTDAEAQAIYEELAGAYQDRVSQRATATVTAMDGFVYIDVTWGNSADETMEWTMTATLAEDGLLVYNDEKCETFKGETATVNYENAEGFFAPGKDGLYWTGAATESCQSCIFEKIPQ